MTKSAQGSKRSAEHSASPRCLASPPEAEKRRKHSGASVQAADGARSDTPNAESLQTRVDELFGSEDFARLASEDGAEASSAAAAVGLPGRDPDAAALGELELLQQRTAALQQLHQLYSDEFWSLMDELRTRHQHFLPAGVTPMAETDNDVPSMLQVYRQQQPAVSVAQPAAHLAAADADGVQGVDAADGTSSEAAGQGLPSFSDMEELILSRQPDEPATEKDALLSRYMRFRSQLQILGRLEECASAATGREMDGGNALATLVGSRQRFLIKRTTVILGRAAGSASEQVDIDLSTEGDARQVSRRAACLTLQADGAWHLRVIGRRSLTINGRPLQPGAACRLPHLSLLQAGRARLLFMANAAAMRQVLRRSLATAIRQDG